jgi:high-affinity nickel-transport protein
MIIAIQCFLARSATDVRARIVAIYTLLALLNIGAWVWALLAFRGEPGMLSIALVVYGLGLRHAVDADHIAAIDNVTRKLMQAGQRPVSVGFFFALGHSTVVTIVVALLAALAGSIGALEGWTALGGIIGTLVSATFLLLIAGMNIFILAGIIRSFRLLKAGGAYVEEDLDLLLNNRGVLARLFRPVFKLVTQSWHMFPLGVLFGLGFDTATEVATFGLSAAQAVKGTSFGAIMTFPVLFAAGMSLVDTSDGLMMLGAYRWAFVKPTRKLFYNMTITLISILAAALIGGLEALGLIAGHLKLKGEVWDAIGSLNENFNLLGFAIIGIFAVCWGVSCLAYRAMDLDRIDNKAATSG